MAEVKSGFHWGSLILEGSRLVDSNCDVCLLETYFVGGDSESDNIGVMRDILRPMGRPVYAFGWLCRTVQTFEIQRLRGEPVRCHRAACR